MNQTCPQCDTDLKHADPSIPHVMSVRFCSDPCVTGWYSRPEHDRRHMTRSVAFNRRTG